MIFQNTFPLMKMFLIWIFEVFKQQRYTGLIMQEHNALTQNLLRSQTTDFHKLNRSKLRILSYKQKPASMFRNQNLLGSLYLS